MNLTAPQLTLSILVGLVLGSFAVTAGMRWARGEGALAGRSHCDACAKPLSYWESAPIVGYLRQAGRCLGCRAPISPLHPLGETAGAAIVVSALLAAGWPRGGLVAVLGLLLLANVAVDLRARRLPNLLNGAIALTGGLLAAMAGTARLLEGLAAAAVIAGVLLLLRSIRGASGRDPGLGLGDVKLLAALALWLGTASPAVLALAASIGLAAVLVRRPRESGVAFGPYIAAAAWAVGLIQEAGLWPALI